MSAVLAHEQIRDVINDLELLQDIRSAMRDLRDSEVKPGERVCLTISSKGGIKEMPICFVHGGSEWLAAVALQAMEREVKNRLASKDIDVEAPEYVA